MMSFSHSFSPVGIITKGLIYIPLYLSHFSFKGIDLLAEKQDVIALQHRTTNYAQQADSCISDDVCNILQNLPRKSLEMFHQGKKPHCRWIFVRVLTLIFQVWIFCLHRVSAERTSLKINIANMSATVPSENTSSQCNILLANIKCLAQISLISSCIKI